MKYPDENHPPYERRLTHKIRMMFEYLRGGGYSVFYIVLDGDVAGHIVVARGGRRLAVSKEEDVVLGPIFISPNVRGRGLGTAAIQVILNELNLEYNYAYEFIKDGNIASIRTAEKNGYQFIGRAKESGIMRRLVMHSDGSWLIYRYSRKN